MNESNETSSVSALARKFKVKLPSAVEILSKLETKGLVVRKRWRVPQLTKRGEKLAELVMHQHRVLEVYLNEKLGVNSDMSCAQAGKIDYLFDTDVIEKMCRVLNRPATCLHGFPIQHED
jgi:DtxR family Mn-dependent transcriptional regulator